MIIFTRCLSGPYFTAIDLANFARELDEDERMRMAEGGLDSPQYLRYFIFLSSVVHNLYCNLFHVLCTFHCQAPPTTPGANEGH